MTPLALVAPAWAHRPGLSNASVDATSITLTFARPELEARVPLEDLDAARILLRELTLDRVEVAFGGVPCVAGEPEIAPAEADGVQIRAPLHCPAAGEGRYTSRVFDVLDPGHRQVLEAFGQPVGVLDAGSPTVAFTGASDRGEVATRFLGLGVEHIWTGYDHLLFLLGLLLAAPGLRAMLLVVTGFTVAHSITLSLAALGLVSLPSRVVEPAIAASIAWVGVENFFSPGTRRRVATTFLLGLVHGFGFAGLLAELGLPRDALVVALAAFNGGVELGQAAVVAVVLPALLWLRRYPWWSTRAVPAASALVAAFGVGWLVERLG